MERANKVNFKFLGRFASIAIASAICLFVLVGYVFLNQNGILKSGASLEEDQLVGVKNQLAATSIRRVCPTGVPGQHECDYVGPEGIQQAINDSRNTDTVLIKAGTYEMTHFTRIRDKSIHIQGEGYRSTIVKGTAAMSAGNPIFIIDGNGGGNISITQMTISDNPADAGLNVLGQNYQVTLTGLFITRNYGYGVYIAGTNSVYIRNNVMVDNQLGGIYFDAISGSPSYIINNTLYHNGFRTGSHGHFALFTGGANLTVKNNIVATITGSTETGIFAQQRGNLPLSYQYNDVSGHTSNYLYFSPDGTNLQSNPLLVANTYRLYPNSPLINAGDPSELDPDGTRSDMGAYGGPEACVLDATVPGCSQQPTPTIPVAPTSTPVPTTVPSPTRTGGFSVSGQLLNVGTSRPSNCPTAGYPGLNGATMILSGIGVRHGMVTATVNGVQGYFRFTNIPSGQYNVCVQAFPVGYSHYCAVQRDQPAPPAPTRSPFTSTCTKVTVAGNDIQFLRLSARSSSN